MNIIESESGKGTLPQNPQCRWSCRDGSHGLPQSISQPLACAEPTKMNYHDSHAICRCLPLTCFNTPLYQHCLIKKGRVAQSLLSSTEDILLLESPCLLVGPFVPIFDMHHTCMHHRYMLHTYRHTASYS